jgi:hypothetical protein
MPYTKTNWDETTAITVERLNKQEDGIGDVEDYVDAEIAIANQNILDAKTPLATAITNKGVNTASTSSFTQMATNIGAITAIKSVQSGVYTTPITSSTTGTIPLSNPVNVSKSVIIAFRYPITSGNGFGLDWLWDFNSSTEIGIRRDGTSTTSRTRYSYQVIEFNDWVKVLSGQDFSGTRSISSVDPNKSFITCTNRSSSSGSGGIVITPYIINPTSIYLGDNSTNVRVRWFVVDFSGV